MPRRLHLGAVHEAGAAQLRPFQIGAVEHGFEEIGVLQPGPRKVGLAQYGAAQIGARDCRGERAGLAGSP